MDVHIGGAISAIKVILSPIEKLFLYRAYRISSVVHSHRQVLGRFPHDLTEHLEYDINWEKYYLGDKMNSPLFWIRALKGKEFSKVVLSVTASGAKVRYQDVLTLYKVGSTPTRAALPSIPFRNVRVEENRVFTSYTSIETRLIELNDQDGKPVNYYGSVSAIHPMDRLEVAMGLEKGDVEKWGEVFNLQFIEGEIREERIRLMGSRFTSLKPVYALRAWIFGYDWIVKLNFWRKNLIFAKQLQKAFKEFWRQKLEVDEFRKEKDKGETLAPVADLTQQQ